MIRIITIRNDYDSEISMQIDGENLWIEIQNETDNTSSSISLKYKELESLMKDLNDLKNQMTVEL